MQKCGFDMLKEDQRETERKQISTYKYQKERNNWKNGGGLKLNYTSYNAHSITLIKMI